MNATATLMAKVAVSLNSFNRTILADIVTAIKASNDLTDAQKLAFVVIINSNPGISKLLEAILYSDFTEFGLPSELLPTVDDELRGTILSIIKTVVLAQLTATQNALSTFGTALSNTQDEQLLTYLTAE